MDALRFGAIVRRLREARGWTRHKLATRAGLSPQYVGVLEEGGNIASLTTALDLAEVLGADIGEITRELSVARNTPRKAAET